MSHAAGHSDNLPDLPYTSWKDTLFTLHMWTQIVGKVRLSLAPLVNHWWNLPLYVTARGLTTSPMPHGDRTFEIAFDFLSHALAIETSEGGRESFDLTPMAVADFCAEVMDRLRRLDIDVHIWTMPSEIDTTLRFDEDRVHAAYDAEYAQRLWRALVQIDRVFKLFRARFIGKVSPVHFFWGSFDHAVTRFSGRTAPRFQRGAPNLAD